jgi:hypothetical protein
VSVIHTHVCENYSRVSRNHTLRVKLHFACGNCTVRVEINVEITLVRVGVTFVPVEITLREKITLCVCRIHTRACRNHNREFHIHTHTC